MGRTAERPIFLIPVAAETVCTGEINELEIKILTCPVGGWHCSLHKLSAPLPHPPRHDHDHGFQTPLVFTVGIISVLLLDSCSAQSRCVPLWPRLRWTQLYFVHCACAPLQLASGGVIRLNVGIGSIGLWHHNKWLSIKVWKGPSGALVWKTLWPSLSYRWALLFLVHTCALSKNNCVGFLVNTSKSKWRQNCFLLLMMQ